VRHEGVVAASDEYKGSASLHGEEMSYRDARPAGS
jgi:hypothetical protein